MGQGRGAKTGGGRGSSFFFFFFFRFLFCFVFFLVFFWVKKGLLGQKAVLFVWGKDGKGSKKKGGLKIKTCFLVLIFLNMEIMVWLE